MVNTLHLALFLVQTPEKGCEAVLNHEGPVMNGFLLIYRNPLQTAVSKHVSPLTTDSAPSGHILDSLTQKFWQFVRVSEFSKALQVTLVFTKAENHYFIDLSCRYEITITS